MQKADAESGTVLLIEDAESGTVLLIEKSDARAMTRRWS
jgi:hypothetical protein